MKTAIHLLLVVGAVMAFPACKSWSGYWWPYHMSETCRMYADDGPAEKYDNYVTAKTGVSPGWKSWEKKYHDGDVPGWWGHCHALVAASILEKEPLSQKRKLGVRFSILDQKALLTACNYTITSDMFVGSRYNGNPGDDIDDPSPHLFHKTLVDWLGGPKKEAEPIAMDANREAPVWNYVIYDYQSSFMVDSAEPDKKHVTTVVNYLDYGPCDPNFTGRVERTKTYTYWVKGDINNPTSGAWEGGSINDHPDFLWHPGYALKASGCPIDCAIVDEIVK